MSIPIPATAYLDQLLDFVSSIGIAVTERPVAEATFLPGILIEKGGLIIDRKLLLYPGDVLHEAGHIAVTTAAERPQLGGNITANNPEKEGEELAVLAWTYAACLALNIPAEVVFHPAGYKDNSEWLIDNFQTGGNIGLPLLVWMGLTTNELYPRMARWLRT